MPNFESLSYQTNSYQAVLIDAASLPADAGQFSGMLSRAINGWRTAGYHSVWLDVPIDQSALIPVATANGFEFHSTYPDSLTLTLKLVPDIGLPGGPTRQIGVGGVVVNEREELLVIVERAHAKTMPNYFKLPGGVVDPKERLEDAAEREVWEETGIKAKFEKVTMFRHMLDYRPNMSDIYFICILKPLTYDITPQASEIDRALWMPLDSYLNHPDVSVFNKMVVELGLKDGGLHSGWFDGYHLDQKRSELYFPE